MKVVFYSHANRTHFQKKGFAPSLVLKVTVFGTRKWTISLEIQEQQQVLNYTVDSL